MRVLFIACIGSLFLATRLFAESAIPSPMEAPSGSQVVRLPHEAWLAHAETARDFIHRDAIAPTSTYVIENVTWIVDSTTAAVQDVGTAISAGAVSAYATLAALPSLPDRTLRGFVDRVHSDTFDEFSELVNDSGFALADITFGMRFFPELAIHFKHVRDLTPEELETLSVRIDEFIMSHGNNVGYIEASILRGLVRAGRYAGSVDLSAVDLAILPFPGLTLILDPLGYEEERANMLIRSFEEAELALELERGHEERLLQIEKMLGLLAQSNPELARAIESAESPETP